MNLWTLFEVMINLYQGSLMVYFLKNKLRPKRKSYLADTICALSVATLFSLYSFFEIYLSDSVVILITSAYSFCLFSNKWYIILFWNIFLYVLFVSLINLVIAFYTGALGASIAMIATSGLTRLTFVLSTNILLLIAVFLISKLRWQRDNISLPAVAALLVQNAINFVALEVLFSMFVTTHELDNMLIVVCICLCNRRSKIETERN